MAGTAEVLQEYLVKLGYQTDTISLKKFEDSLGDTGKKVLKVGTAVTTAVIAVEAAAVAFAYSMRKIYFESELSNTSVKNLKALEYAGKQIGITGDAMGNAIHGMAQAMRLNPGLQGLIESFGIKVTGRDTSDVMLDFVGALKNMPEFTAAKYASMFGLDPDTYHQMANHLDELKKKKEEQLAMAKKYGLDLDKQKKTMLEYTESIDRLSAKFEVLGSVILVNFVEPFKTVASWIDHVIEGWTMIAGGLKYEKGSRWDEFVNGKEKGSGAQQPGTGKIEPSPISSSGGRISVGKINRPNIQAPVEKTSAGTTPANKANLIMTLLQGQGWTKEQAAGIAANLQRESGFNPHVEVNNDKEKAYGIAQWHRDRQEDFKKWSGHDIRQSTLAEQLKFVTYELRKGKEQRAGRMLMQAGSAEEAGRVISRHYERPGLTPEAQAAEANLRGTAAARLGGGTPGNVTIHQKTEIKVTGTGAEATGKAVVGAQTRVNADLARNFKPAIS